MKNIISLLAVAAISLIGCGDNLKRPDGGGKDGKPADAQCSNCPAAPTLGAQIDRMGRPAINTALNHGFDKSAAAPTAKQGYNENAMGSTWPGYTPEFAKNLGIIDALDTGVCDNGICESTEGSATCGSDCGSAVAGSGNGCG